MDRKEGRDALIFCWFLLVYVGRLVFARLEIKCTRGRLDLSESTLTTQLT